MAKSTAHYVMQAMTLSWLTGPVFEKELRVSSRRRRNFILRFMYLAALTGFLSLLWVEMIGRYQYDGNYTNWSQRMSEVGKAITLTIVWFQFAGAQVLAIIMLSSAIGDEIYQKTLGVLMTTPVSSFQIVMGKLLSKLLQVFLLIFLSLPLLAVVRVLGGVPWDFLLVSLCMTVCCTLLVGSLTLLLSIFTRHAYLVIVEAFIGLGIVYLLIPVIAMIIGHDYFHLRESDLISLLGPVNPYLTFVEQSVFLAEGRSAMAGVLISWEWSCLLTLAAAAVMLLLASLLVRKAALQQAVGQPIRLFRRPPPPLLPPAPVLDEAVAGGSAPPAAPLAPVLVAEAVERYAALRTVTDPPILWKELRSPLIRSRRWRWITIAGLLGLLGLTYALCALENELHRRDTQVTYAIVLGLLALGTTAIFSATTITAEKEARSWDLLLLTSQGEWQIVLGKFGGAMVRCLFFWLLLLGHVVVFGCFGIISLAAVPHVLMLAAWALPFLASSGIYFSSAFRRTTAAVIMNLCLVVLIWGAVPAGWAMTAYAINHHEAPPGLKLYLTGNPGVQAGVAIDANVKRYGWGRSYEWPDEHRDWVDSTGVYAAWMAIYLAAGLFLLWRTKTNLRRRM